MVSGMMLMLRSCRSCWVTETWEEEEEEEDQPGEQEEERNRIADTIRAVNLITC